MTVVRRSTSTGRNHLGSGARSIAAFATLALLGLPGCVILRAKAYPPTGAELAVGFVPPVDVRRWSCEGGEGLALVEIGGEKRLFVESQDWSVKNHFDAADGEHWFVHVAVGGYSQIAIDYIVPKDPNGDARIDIYHRIGGHDHPPSGAHLKPYDGVKDSDGTLRPIGDPVFQDVCWSKSGPLAKAAAAASKRPAELLYLGGEPHTGAPPSNSKEVVVERCVGNVDRPIESPLPSPFHFVAGADEGLSRLFVKGSYTRGVQLAELREHNGCLLDFAEGSCFRADTARANGSIFFYFERVRTGYEIVVNPKKGTGWLVVYAPTDLRKGPLPPREGLAGPLSSVKGAYAFICDLKVRP